MTRLARLGWERPDDEVWSGKESLMRAREGMGCRSGLGRRGLSPRSGWVWVVRLVWLGMVHRDWNGLTWLGLPRIVRTVRIGSSCEVRQGLIRYGMSRWPSSGRAVTTCLARIVLDSLELWIGLFGLVWTVVWSGATWCGAECHKIWVDGVG